MKWVRIECSIGDAPMIGALADALGVSIAEAVGLHALVWAKLPELARDGDLSVIPASTLERWVSWAGKRGAFANAYASTCLTEDGVALDWERVNGGPMRESEATTERVRKLREGRKGTPTETTVVTRTARVPVRRTPPVRTPTNGTLTGRSPIGDTAESTDPTHSEPSPQNAVEKSVEKPAKPSKRLQPPAEQRQQPAAVAEMNPPRPAATEPATPRVIGEPSSVLTRFVARFYAGAGKDRRADIARQMNAMLNGAGVKMDGGIVRAVDNAHLDGTLLEVMEEPPRDPNAAMKFVLLKLRDSYLEVLSRRAKEMAGEVRHVRAQPAPEGMEGSEPPGATPMRAALAAALDGLKDVSRETEEGGQ